MATDGGDADTRRLDVPKASLWEIFAEEILKNQKNAPDGCPMGNNVQQMMNLAPDGVPYG